MFVEIQRNLKKPYPIILTAAGSTETQSAISRPNGFEFHHILWVTQGEGLFHFAGEPRHIGAGYGVFMNKDCPHAYTKSGETFATSWVTFQGAEDLLTFYRMNRFKVFKLPAFWKECCAQLSNLCEKGSTVAARSAACYSWLIELLETLEASDVSVFSRVRLYLENNFDKPLTLDEIAEVSGMDKFALCRYYAKERGMSVMSHLKQIRVTKAKQFLKFTVCSVAEIGEMCGFESPSYFGKIFKEETHMTPREYRNSTL
jgi:AraC-like DNA-binding protein